MSSDRQRLMPDGHWTWRTEAYSTLSQGWRVGPLVFTGGQVALDPAGEVLFPGDVARQTTIVYLNIEKVLKEAGATLRDVFKINSYYVCHGDEAELTAFWEAMATARKPFFPDPGPCGTGVRVEGLVYAGLVIEVEAIAQRSAAD